MVYIFHGKCTKKIRKMKKLLAKLAIIAYNQCMRRASRLICPMYIIMEPTVGNDCENK